MSISKQTVRRGYNLISRRYRNDRGLGADAKNMKPWLQWVDSRLPKSSRILELGCGMGIPAAKYFSAKHHYLGIDISDVQIQRAKRLVPRGLFRRADMAKLKFRPSSFEAVLGFYALIHLGLREQKPLFKKIYRWLKPDGIFAATLGWGRWTGREKDWHGAEMFWSHADQGTYRRWLKEAGFKISRLKLIREGKGGHALFLCVKPFSRRSNFPG